MTYVLKHPYGDFGGKYIHEGKTFRTLKEARAFALKTIYKYYPAEGKHFTELEVMDGKKLVGVVEISYKVRGQRLSDYPSKTQKMVYMNFTDHWTPYGPDKNGDYDWIGVVYTLNKDGSLGQKYVRKNSKSFEMISA